MDGDVTPVAPVYARRLGARRIRVLFSSLYAYSHPDRARSEGAYLQPR